MRKAIAALTIVAALVSLPGCVSTLELDKTTLLTVGFGLHATFLRTVEAEAETAKDGSNTDPTSDDGR